MLQIALKNLLRKRVRNALTILGISGGIALCAVSLSIGQHMRNQLGGLFERYQVDLVVQARGVVMPVQSRISQQEYQAISSMPGVRHSSATIIANFRTSFDSMFLIVGISDADHFFSRVTVLEGDWYTPGQNEILLGEMASRVHGFPLGSRMLLSRDEMMRVSGIYSMGFNIMDGAALMDIDDARRILQAPESINMMFIQVEPEVDLGQLIEQINRTFPNLHASPSSEMTDQIGVLPYVEFMAFTISIIAVMISCLVIMNSFFMTVSDRIREIGALAAMGWSRSRTAMLFVTEAMLLASLAWMAGLMMASAFLAWSQNAMNIGLAILPLNIAASTVLLTLGLSLTLSAVGTLVPVLLALRMGPAEALRQE